MDGAVGFRSDVLARLRTARGLTLAELARLVSVSDRSRVQLWESGAESPRPAALVTLAAALDVHPLELLAGSTATPTIATLRCAAGLTRGQAAARVGMSRPAYLRLDGGRGRRELPEDLLAALAAAYGVEQSTVLAAHRRSRINAGTDRALTSPSLSELRQPLTAADLAAQLGITERTWYRIEAGQRRSPLPDELITRLAGLLNTTPAEVTAAHEQSRRHAAAKLPR